MTTRQHSQPYKRVLDALLDDIEAGRLRPGDQLPSVRELADAHDVAPMTARNALQRLRDQGRASPTHGVGWFVTSPPAPEPTLEERVAALEATVADLKERLESDHDSNVPERQ